MLTTLLNKHVDCGVRLHSEVTRLDLWSGRMLVKRLGDVMRRDASLPSLNDKYIIYMNNKIRYD